MGLDLPLYPYKKYPDNILNIAHKADQWIPLAAMIYTSLLFILYCQQYFTRRRLWFSPTTLPLHFMGIISLFILFIYEVLNFLLSNNIYSDLPSPLNDCNNYIKLSFIAFIFVKYAIVLDIVFNLSHINQNPFINPRYKYIGKKHRIRLQRFFKILIAVIFLFLAMGVYGAYSHSHSEQYKDSPNNFDYCTETFTLYTFLFTFGGDILGVLMFGCLFGRNACELCRRKVKPHQRHKYDVGNLSMVDEYDNDKCGDHNKISYDLDDPIRNKLGFENKIYSINASENGSPNKNVQKGSDKYGGGMTDDLILDLGGTDEDDYMARMNKDKRALKHLRQKTLIEAEEIISEEEMRGIREQKRVVQLIWIMLCVYWCNILLVITFGLLENVSCVTLMVTSTCIVLMNDYEFGSTYWRFRTCVCKVGMCLCCVCRRTYFCNECFCGEEKVFEDNFNPIHGYKGQFDRSNLTEEQKKFVRL